ncbi:MAG: hypothetical protein K2W84_11955 [Burkholderiales bacterium]|nr:hypothetical protein [Burkholderiales bacterium]
MSHSRTHRDLARGLIAEVGYCPDCGLVHLNIGALTLRLQPSAVIDLRDTLSRAVEQFDHAPQARASGLSCH